MTRKPRKLTRQEELITLFTRRSISANATFHPHQWGNGREPADMVVYFGRSILIFNMTESRSYLDDLISHNLVQAIDRISEWELSRRPVRGESVGRTFSIGWDDIDHIAVFCVVDGPNAACCKVPRSLLGSNEKVRVCYSVTSGLLKTLADLRGGARDLLRFCRMHLTSTPVLSNEASAAMLAYFDVLAMSSGHFGLAEPKRIVPTSPNGRRTTWLDQQLDILVRPRNHAADQDNVFADFSWNEILPVAAFVAASIQKMEDLPKGNIIASSFGNEAKMLAVVSTTQEGLNNELGTIFNKARELSCSVIYTANALQIGLLPMFVHHISFKTQWAIDQELHAAAY